ncbi:hypothetical protein Leryth_017794 [Lithospermum erythrorhizon]|nr:hypothetical protein Leryth_017794 [Lithospermum erythrorhizon]
MKFFLFFLIVILLFQSFTEAISSVTSDEEAAAIASMHVLNDASFRLGRKCALGLVGLVAQNAIVFHQVHMGTTMPAPAMLVSRLTAIASSALRIKENVVFGLPKFACDQTRRY